MLITKRKAINLTQADLAKQLGEYQSFVARLESGQRSKRNIACRQSFHPRWVCAFRKNYQRHLRIHCFANWQIDAPDSHCKKSVCIGVVMNRKLSVIHQRDITRVLKGAAAGGFRITTVKVDNEGAIVLYSYSQEREEREAPRLQANSNEWDEVLKK